MIKLHVTYVRVHLNAPTLLCDRLIVHDHNNNNNCNTLISRQLKNTPKPRIPGVKCTTSALIRTSCTRGVQENAAIGLVVLQSTDIVGLIICFAIHFLCETIE